MRSFVKFKSGQQSTNHPGNRLYGEVHYEREMKKWKPFRYCGVFSSLCALVLGCAAAWSNQWLTGRGFSVGIWDCCFYNETEEALEAFCLDKRNLWQTCVIGLLLFALAFGPLATFLSLLGLCSSALQKKIYYFNSAGEIYLICGVSIVVSLVVYSVGVELVERKMSGHSYGSGYGLCCVAAGFFFVGALCMCVDDVAQSASSAANSSLCKCCCGEDDDVRV